MASNNQQGAKLVIYWLEKSRANRITWLLEELNLEYEIKTFKRNEHMRAPEELKKIHPLGKSPMLGITPAGSDKETVIAESATIIEYVCEHFGKQLIPKKYPEGREGELCAETEEWLRYKFLMDYTEGSLFTFLVASLIPAGLRNAPAPFFIKPIIRGIAGKVDSSFVDPELKLHFDFLEDYLIKSPSNGEYFCGLELSGADIMLHFALEGAAQRVPINETSYPKLYAYMKKLQQRPAYARAGQAVEKATGEKFVPFSEVKFM